MSVADKKELKYNAIEFNARGTKIVSNIYTIRNCDTIIKNIHQKTFPKYEYPKIQELFMYAQQNINGCELNILPGEYYLDCDPNDVHRFLNYLTGAINIHKIKEKDPKFVDDAVRKLCEIISFDYSQHIGKP